MSAPVTAATVPGPAAAGLPRLLAGVREDRPLTLAEHLRVHGPAPEVRRPRRRSGESLLIEEVARAGLLGRGGAGFPLASKLRAVAAGRGRPVVVANGAEGEPASLKDHLLLETLPQLVLDGALLAAQAVGSDEAIVAACEFAPEGLAAVSEAIEERERATGREGPRLRLVVVPGHYVAGQEAALVNFLDGGTAKPRFTPPRVFEAGVRRRPTLVSNVETLAHLALIARHGADWFRELGLAGHSGSALVTLSGPVAHPGVYEIEHGSSLSALIEAAGGLHERVRGALLGGYSGTWVPGRLLHTLALSNEHLAPHGATLGAGVVALLSERACPVAETTRLARWMAEQSAHQCGPCIHGLDALAGTLARLGAGHSRGAAQRLDMLASLVARRGACAHPDGTVNQVLSALEAFREEFTAHARNGHCQACSRAPELPLPNRPVSDVRLRGGVLG